MSQNNGNASARRPKAFISTIGTTQIHLRNPLIVAWWSMAFPGLGHLLLSRYLRGYILFIWEIIINYQSHLNLAIIYSITGQFNSAKEVLDKEWFFLYIPTYVYAIWDSYRIAVDSNNNYVLASREDADTGLTKMSAVEINYLDKRSPWISLVWSAFSPGMGHLYVNRLPSSLYIMIWWVVIIYNSKFLPALFYTTIGEIATGSSYLNPQWFLNIPSIYLFAMYDAYVKTVENNKLYEWEQSKFLNKNYQYRLFEMPLCIESTRGEPMYIISTFEHSIKLETAITAIQMKGIAKEAILAVSMDTEDGPRKVFDTIHQSDGLSTIDIPMVLGTAFAVLGSAYGFLLEAGPIVWGVVGAFVGACIGFAIKLCTVKKHSKKPNRAVVSEVVVIVQCNESQAEMVKETLWDHSALGVRKLVLGSKE